MSTVVHTKAVDGSLEQILEILTELSLEHPECYVEYKGTLVSRITVTESRLSDGSKVKDIQLT